MAIAVGFYETGPGSPELHGIVIHINNIGEGPNCRRYDRNARLYRKRGYNWLQPMKREIIKPVVAINIFIVVLLLGVCLQQLLGEIRMSHLLRNKPLFVWHDGSFVGPAIMIAVIVFGTVCELRRSKVAIFVNLGIPFCLLVVVLVGCIRAWRENPQEVEISLILVALPLFVLTTLYAIFYRRIAVYSL